MKRKAKKNNDKEMGKIMIILFLLLGLAAILYSFMPLPEKQLSSSLAAIISFLFLVISAIFYFVYWQEYDHPWPNLWKKIKN